MPLESSNLMVAICSNSEINNKYLKSQMVTKMFTIDDIDTKKEGSQTFVDMTELSEVSKTARGMSELAALRSENEYLRQELSKLTNILESERHRHDEIISSQLNSVRLMLEAPRKESFWKRLRREKKT